MQPVDSGFTVSLTPAVPADSDLRELSLAGLALNDRFSLTRCLAPRSIYLGNSFHFPSGPCLFQAIHLLSGCPLLPPG